MDSLQGVLTQINDWLYWLPQPVDAAVIVALAMLAALAVNGLVRRAISRMLAARYPDLLPIFKHLQGVTRLAMLVLAALIAVPVAPFDDRTEGILARILMIAVICLIGWAAITALRIGADIYLGRFRLDVQDNLLARKHNTQVRILLRTLEGVVVLITLGAALMTFSAVRQYGVSLFASAGVAGIVAGLAARPVLSNLIAGVQLAMTQPIRLEDAVIAENEYGNIEEINSTYVVVRLWDQRRMVVPLTYFIEKPFQNWTRQSSALLGYALIYVDYRAPVQRIRQKFEEIVRQSPKWDGRAVGLQVTDVKETTMQLRCLYSAASSGDSFDLGCEVREKLIDFLQREHPEALPNRRLELHGESYDAAQPANGRARPAIASRN